MRQIDPGIIAETRSVTKKETASTRERVGEREKINWVKSNLGN